MGSKMTGEAKLNTSNPPPGWGTDTLTQTLDAARHNQWATFWNKKPESVRLIAIDELFASVWADNWHEPPASAICAQFLLRAHSAYRAAAGLVLAGQLPEAYVLCRSMLEYAAYAVRIHRSPELGVVWLKRHTDSEGHKMQRRAFTNEKVKASVKDASAQVGKWFEDFYDLTIDLGAHPNELAVVSNMSIKDQPGSRRYEGIMQHSAGLPLDLALITLARCAMICLEMFTLVFQARFEQIGLDVRMRPLRNGL